MDKFLVTADFHLTDNPLEEYRWQVFSWLKDLIEEFNILTVFILGDLTDEKDRHSARLVNRIIQELRDLLRFGVTVEILKGNHDYVDVPFFGFLEKDFSQNWRFYSSPKVQAQKKGGYRFLFLPHTKNPKEDWINYGGINADFVFCHQLFSGVNLGTSVDTDEMGMPGGIFKELGIKGKVVSGDIHIPQRVGPVLYCGAPHPITFADDYDPRVLLWDGEKFESILRPKPFVKRHLLKITKLESFEDWDMDPGDQVKIEMSLGREDAALWEDWKARAERIAEKKGVMICGFKVSLHRDMRALQAVQRKYQLPKDPKELLKRYCDETDSDELLYEVGKELIKGK